MNFFFRIPVHVLFLVLASGCLPVKADLIELTNGDHYRGTIIGMTLTNIDFMSEIQGRVRLPRDKVAQITLHEVVARQAAVKPSVAAPLILSGSPAVLAPASTPPADAVIQQMRQQGVDSKVIAQVQQQIFGKAGPEASQKFNEMVSGLMSGSISMNDLRAQAQSSINQIKAAKKELGDDAGEMLDGYLGILEKFINESSADTAITLPQPASKTTATNSDAGN